MSTPVTSAQQIDVFGPPSLSCSLSLFFSLSLSLFLSFSLSLFLSFSLSLFLSLSLSLSISNFYRGRRRQQRPGPPRGDVHPQFIGVLEKEKTGRASPRVKSNKHQLHNKSAPSFKPCQPCSGAGGKACCSPTALREWGLHQVAKVGLRSN